MFLENVVLQEGSCLSSCKSGWYLPEGSKTCLKYLTESDGSHGSVIRIGNALKHVLAIIFGVGLLTFFVSFMFYTCVKRIYYCIDPAGFHQHTFTFRT